MNYLKKSVSFLRIDLRLLIMFGPRAAWLDFLKNFIFRSNSTQIGKKIYTQKYSNLKYQLSRKLSGVLKQFENTDFNDTDLQPIGNKSPIWFFWWQGIDENTPTPVIDCLNSILSNCESHPVVVLSKSNIQDYIEIPDFYYVKLSQGAFSLTHFSDILRLELLYSKGGIWMDSTIMMTAPIPKRVENSPFFTIKHGQFSDWHVSMGKWSGFFLASGKHNPMFHFMRDMMRAYWQKYDFLACYLLIDCWIALGYEKWASFKAIIDSVNYNNQEVFFLDDHGNDNFHSQIFEHISDSTSLFKIHYKRKFVKATTDGSVTYYGSIIQRNDAKREQLNEQ